MPTTSLSPAARLASFAQGCAKHHYGTAFSKISTKNVAATIIVGIAAAAATALLVRYDQVLTERVNAQLAAPVVDAASPSSVDNAEMTAMLDCISTQIRANSPIQGDPKAFEDKVEEHLRTLVTSDATRKSVMAVKAMGYAPLTAMAIVCANPDAPIATLRELQVNPATAELLRSNRAVALFQEAVSQGIANGSALSFERTSSMEESFRKAQRNAAR